MKNLKDQRKYLFKTFDATKATKTVSSMKVSISIIFIITFFCAALIKGSCIPDFFENHILKNAVTDEHPLLKIENYDLFRVTLFKEKLLKWKSFELILKCMHYGDEESIDALNTYIDPLEELIEKYDLLKKEYEKYRLKGGSWKPRPKILDPDVYEEFHFCVVATQPHNPGCVLFLEKMLLYFYLWLNYDPFIKYDGFDFSVFMMALSEPPEIQSHLNVLLDIFPDCVTRLHYDMYPLFLTFDCRRTFNMMIKRGADPFFVHSKTKRTIIHEFCINRARRYGNYSVTIEYIIQVAPRLRLEYLREQHMLKYGDTKEFIEPNLWFDLNSCDWKNLTPMFYAIYLRNTVEFEYLLDNGVIFNSNRHIPKDHRCMYDEYEDKGIYFFYIHRIANEKQRITLSGNAVCNIL